MPVVEANGRVDAYTESNNTKLYIGWRGLYTDEGGNVNPLDQPAVIPAQVKTATGWRKYNVSVEFTRSIQLLTWAVWRSKNLLVTTNNWRGVMDANTWGTNYNGWRDGSAPKIARADWVTPQDTNTENPHLMDGIVMAGSFRTFLEHGDYLVARPGIDGIDVNKPLPDVETVYKNHWYFPLMIRGKSPYYFAQGHGLPIYMPYFLKEETFYNKAYFQRWQSDRLPDPLKIGG